MAEKLSESLTQLAIKTRSIEDKVKRARDESKEKLDNKIEESKAELQIKKDSFITQAEFVLAKEECKLDSFYSLLHQKAEHFKSESKNEKYSHGKELKEKKQERDLVSSILNYNKSIDYAKSCIEWAMIALAEVEISTLEAFMLRQQVENLKEPKKYDMA